MSVSEAQGDPTGPVLYKVPDYGMLEGPKSPPSPPPPSVSVLPTRTPE